MYTKWTSSPWTNGALNYYWIYGPYIDHRHRSSTESRMDTEIRNRENLHRMQGRPLGRSMCGGHVLVQCI